MTLTKNYTLALSRFRTESTNKQYTLVARKYLQRFCSTPTWNFPSAKSCWHQKSVQKSVLEGLLLNLPKTQEAGIFKKNGISL